MVISLLVMSTFAFNCKFKERQRLPNSALDSKFDFSTKKQDIRAIFYKYDSAFFALLNECKLICGLIFTDFLNIRAA